MQSLIDRFEELTEPPAAVEEGDAPKEGSESAHNLALEAATRSATGQDVALTKLRTHFQKVSVGVFSSLGIEHDAHECPV